MQILFTLWLMGLLITAANGASIWFLSRSIPDTEHEQEASS